MTKKSRSQPRGRGRPAPRREDQVRTFAEAWSVLRSSSASREQKGRLVRMFAAALILFAATGVTAAGNLV